VDLPSFAPKGQFIVDKYRQAFPEVVEYWNDIGDAAIRATKTQGSIEKVGAVAFKFMEVGGKPFLLCRLPSGRSLWYFNPTVKKTMAPWGSLIDSLHYECMASMKSGGKAWMEISTYGAHLVENICQAVCRDLLAYSIINVTDTGLEPILHIHDELVVECPAPKGSGDLAQYERLVAETPEWAEGFPVAAAGWIHNRYQKD
jgi:DNA polymerase